MVSYQQTGGTTACGVINTPEPEILRPGSMRAVLGAAPGAVALDLEADTLGQYREALQFEIAPGLVLWPAGTWTIRWDVTIGTPDVVWSGVRIRRTRGCGIVSTIHVHGSSTLPVAPVSLVTPGTKTMVVSGVPLSVGAPDDRVLVSCVINNGAAALRGWSVLPSLLLDTPLQERSNPVLGWEAGRLGVSGVVAGRIAGA